MIARGLKVNLQRLARSRIGAEPVRIAVAIKPAARASLAPAIILLLLALAALLGAQPSGYPREMEIGAIVLACLGAVLLIARLLRRR